MALLRAQEYQWEFLHFWVLKWAIFTTSMVNYPGLDRAAIATYVSFLSLAHHFQNRMVYIHTQKLASLHSDHEDKDSKCPRNASNINPLHRALPHKNKMSIKN
jgi:hypothetical protein